MKLTMLLVVVGLVTLAAWAMWSVTTSCPVPLKGTVALIKVKQVSAAFQMYAAYHDDRLPPFRGWSSRLAPYCKNDAVFETERDRGVRDCVAMNETVGGLKLDQADEQERTVLAFEVTRSLRGSFGGLGDAFADRDGKVTLGFLDGHAKHIRARDASALWWVPRQKLDSRRG